jgi:uncharacterized protein (DUF58 family)
MKWYAGALVLLALALVLQMGLLAYAMYVLLALLLISRAVARQWSESLSATRQCHRLSAEIGESVPVAVNISQHGFLPIAWLLAEDLLPAAALKQHPPRLRVTGRRMMVEALWPAAAKSLYYQLHFEMRGYYQVGPLVLETGDLFGLHRRYRVATEPHFILVYPKVLPLEGYEIASRRPIGEIRLTHRLFEDPTRISGVRLYQPGDPLNRVHWRATARTGELHSKTYEASTIAGATLLLAFHRAEYKPGQEPLVSELAVTTAASLANAVFELGQQVGLVTNGRDAADRIRTEGWEHDYRSRAAALKSAAMAESSTRLEPLVVETRRGPEQYHRILETLARVELTEGLSVSALVAEAASRLPHDATVIAILPEVSPETALALGNLRRRGYAVFGVIVTFHQHDYLGAAGRLLNEGIASRHVNDEAAIAALCREQMVHAM